MTHTREDVVSAVKRTFPAERAEEILALLDCYGADSSADERARVQLAILALSQGDDGKLLHYVDAALVDFRDVLSWAEDDGQSPHERAVLEVLREAWSWAIPQPLRIEAISYFGNVVVACADGALWRVCPEALAAQSLGSERDLLEWLDDDEFREDWSCLAWVDAAREALGVPGEGQCYGFRRWPVLGGAYAVENFAIKTATEWLAASGDVGRQVGDLPDGVKVRLEVTDGVREGRQEAGTVRTSVEDFVEAAREGLAQQTSAHASAWRFGEETEWSADLERGELSWSFADGTVAAARAQVVGTYDTNDGSFLWGWDHPSVPEPLREHARLARQWGESKGVRVFTERKVSCSEQDAWSFAAVTNRIAGANGVYRGPSGAVLVFFTFGEIAIERAT